ncbi:wiskott-Aldrich syndrome protein family member 2-like [Dorcoceras hygrometricum]|uniref:Wiskott-Aldrich syndrome protein family member 2-like n=1 Tax=Dorcoceras hygrometricum TaxID=472368 RepID=A0A2Z7A0F9_9LAMI|nr:wiskott-Aldrich syndrome protein family member 2-like [Dorcoceras hygrometricum]
MATKLEKLLPLIFSSAILHHLILTTSQECPYPCYPPPTGPGNNPIVGTTPPVSTTPPAAFSPPFSLTPPAAGYFPFTPPSPNYYGVAPPPPEPMVSWFPFYYRRPPHQDQSSSLSTEGSRNNSLMFLSLFFASFLFCFPLIM